MQWGELVAWSGLAADSGGTEVPMSELHLEAACPPQPTSHSGVIQPLMRVHLSSNQY